MVEVSELSNGDKCIMSSIYGDYLRVERQKLWRDIEKYCAIEFGDCVEKVKLEDVDGKGCDFTWFRGATMRKLDRVMVNREWSSKYSRSYVVFEAPGLSDHTPMSIMVEEVEVKFGSTFKFHEFWCKHAEYMELLKMVWAVKVDGNKMVVIIKKLTEVKKALKEFNLKHFNKLSQQVKEKEFEVEMVQKSILSGNGSDGDYYKEKKIREKLYILKSAEESYFRAKARVSWTMLGDDCTRFFHPKMRSHHTINLKAGNTLEEDKKIANLFTNQVPAERVRGLIKPVTDEEIKEVLWSMGNNKAPGPNGFIVEFFKQGWEVVQKDVIEDVKCFYATRRMARGLSATTITLIPKKKCPLTMKDYRPIACCNVI
ncbi:hypothetical protein LIER_22979 [Lithospermum erythrorhizon]|uniref:RNA-directed DNA polymerase, eukaryota, reverse transcriptase zinc-binding domain protein n=1 Tax=Lithospermum erythrorhizon TaxID=34254 RepID=A0AAV3R009_LITER